MAKKIDLPEPIIPNDSWKIVKLGDYVKILNGYPFDSGRFTNSSENTFPLIRIRDVVRGYTETFTDEDCPDEYKIKKDEILIGMDGDFNISRWKSDFGLLNQRVCKIKSASKDLDENFLYYYLPIPLKQINDATPSVTVKHLSSNSLQQLHFPLPTLAEQQRIVKRIETMFSKLDQAQEKAQSVLDSFETRKAAILHKAFTGQLKIDNEELSIADWEEKSFSDLGTSNLGKMLDQNKNTGDEIRYLRNINVRWFDFDLSDLLTMRAKPEEIKKLSVKKGDLFICEGGEPGRCAVWKDENADLIFQKAIHRFRPNDGVSSDFVAYVLYYYNQIGKLSDYFTGTTIKHLTGQSLAKLPIKLPPLNYQLSIVNFLDSILEKESRAKEATKTVLDQIALLKKSILARAFRGEL